MKKYLEYELIDLGHNHLTVYHVIFLVLVFIGVRIVLSLINRVLKREVSRGRIDTGSRYAIYQIVKYIVFVLGITVGLESIGVDVSILIAGSAALLVGIGLGLQQVFYDLISGIIILFERTIKVDDVIEVSGRTGRVKEIGIRTSKIITAEKVMYIIPNSKFLNDAVINWTTENYKTSRFSIRLTVASGSNLELIAALLKAIALAHPLVDSEPAPQMRLVDFGDNGLVLELDFASHERMKIDDVKSDIRLEIDKAFRENNIKIPYPTREVYNAIN